MPDKTIYDTLFYNGRICTMAEGRYSLIENGYIGVSDGMITLVGEESQIPASTHNAQNQVDLGGALVTPGFIDCHTHLIYGGDRAREFEQRLQGVSYEEIARQGGGIMSTVNATRTCDEDELYHSARKRMDILRREGVIAFEIKSGYGLDHSNEEKMLRVATRLRDETGMHVQRSFLGAHALPPEYKGRSDEYINHICTEMLPDLAAKSLIDAVDVFCEGIAFSPAQVRRIFEAAQAHDLPVKIHAEQLSNLGGAALASEFGALSADHIEYLDEDGVQAMAKSGTIATLLPGAFYTLKETQKPPVDLLRQHGVPIALATDHNPGSSPALSLILMMNMGCTLFGMTPEESLTGTTLNAARALGISDRYGSLETGKHAHFMIWDDVRDPAELSYRFGYIPAHRLVYNGV